MSGPDTLRYSSSVLGALRGSSALCVVGSAGWGEWLGDYKTTGQPRWCILLDERRVPPPGGSALAPLSWGTGSCSSWYTGRRRTPLLRTRCAASLLRSGSSSSGAASSWLLRECAQAVGGHSSVLGSPARGLLLRGTDGTRGSRGRCSFSSSAHRRRVGVSWPPVTLLLGHGSPPLRCCTG